MRSDILHVDLDAFYASVERRRNPKLAGRPVVVGGDGNRGVVLSCSYEARAHGVRNGMPSSRAKRLCPDAVFVSPTFETYADTSKIFRSLLESVTPHVEPISLDEAFIDVSGAHTLYGSSEEIAHAIRARVRADLDLICSVGGGPSKLVAKVASRACKPDGVLVVVDAVAFLHPRPVSDLWGVGEVTAGALRAVGAMTIGDVAKMPIGVLRTAVGRASAAHLHAVSMGIDPSPVEGRASARSVGAEETFSDDKDDEDAIEAELLRLSDRVASRLMKAELRARTVTVKIRVADFNTYTRSNTLNVPTSDVWTIFATARDAYRGFRRGRRTIRLLGVTGSGLISGEVSEQLSLDASPDYAGAEEAMTSVRKKFGSGAVKLARLIGDKATRRSPFGLIEGDPAALGEGLDVAREQTGGGEREDGVADNDRTLN
ncbi:MAG: DNA polymerase IV [Actinomycetota bacterium]